MMIVSEYLRDKMFFNTFEEAKEYYRKPEASDVYDLNESLKEEYAGDAYPKVEVIDNYEVECWWGDNNFNGGCMYDTLEEAQKNFKKIIETMKESHEDFEEAEDKEKFINEWLEGDVLYDYIQINKFNEFEESEIIDKKEIKWDVQL